jgi:hypothetical protein
MKELALNILDIVQNSVKAESRHISVKISESVAANSLKIAIVDDGYGISPEILPLVDDPFTTSRTTRKVGMGLPFLKHHAEMAGGGMNIRSEKGNGTAVEACFQLNHIDRQPMGDITGVIKILMIANPKIDFSYTHSTDKGEFSISTGEIKEVLGVSDLSSPGLMQDVQDMMNENLASIGVADLPACSGYFV